MMEKTIAKRVDDNLDRYYPKDHFGVRSAHKMTTKPGSSVYRIGIFDSAQGHRELYAKEYREGAGPNIHEMMSLTAFHGLFLMPRILDYYDDYEGEILISEGVTGQTLTRAILKNVFYPGNKLLLSAYKMGLAISSLQNMTSRSLKRVGDLDLYLIREIENEGYFKTILREGLLNNIRNQAEELKDLKTRVSQYHGDPSPHNILMKDDRVYLLDYSFQDNATFMDPCLYMVSLELMKARYGLPVRDTISQMEKMFKKTYSEMTKETYDRPIWTTIKTLTYLHFLLMYATRKKTLKNTPVGLIDSRYLLKRIKEALK